MHKVYLTQAQRDQAAAKSADDALQDLVAVRKMRSRLTQEALAEKIGISDDTLRARLRNPETFTLKELRRLSAALGMTKEETARCVV